MIEIEETEIEGMGIDIEIETGSSNIRKKPGDRHDKTFVVVRLGGSFLKSSQLQAHTLLEDKVVEKISDPLSLALP